MQRVLLTPLHETLKAETANPPRASIRAQQAAFVRFQSIYNEERPHEALDMRVPAEIYIHSPRAMPAILPEHEYPDDHDVRRVRTDGSMKWQGRLVFVGAALRNEFIGLAAIAEGVFHVHLGSKRLGALHERSATVVSITEESK